MSDLISQKLGGRGWLKDLDQLQKLRAFVDDEAFQRQWMEIKVHNKARFNVSIYEPISSNKPCSGFDDVVDPVG